MAEILSLLIAIKRTGNAAIRLANILSRLTTCPTPIREVASKIRSPASPSRSDFGIPVVLTYHAAWVATKELADALKEWGARWDGGDDVWALADHVTLHVKILPYIVETFSWEGTLAAEFRPEIPIDVPRIDVDVVRRLEEIGKVLLEAADQRVGNASAGREDVDANKPARHSPDFRSVLWYGAAHDFTVNQALIVKILWEAWENRTPDVGVRTLLAKSGVGVARIQDVFKVNGKLHQAWDTMIVSGGTRGTYRLNNPSN
jgi:hypothetical protein